MTAEPDAAPSGDAAASGLRFSALRQALTGQSITALVSALVFVALALALAIVPVPYVVYSPGRAYDVLGLNSEGRPLVKITNGPDHVTTGRLAMTTVSVSSSDSRVTLPEAVYAWFHPDHDALPRQAVYDESKTSEQVKSEEKQLMNSSQGDAVVAGLRAAKVPVEELGMVTAVTVAGPANDRLIPGDLVLQVDGVPVQTPDQAREAIRRHKVGDPVTFLLWRNGAEVTETVTGAASTSNPDIPAVGVNLGVGYRHQPQVTFGVDENIGGPSAGLVFALAVFDRATPGALMKDRSIAGTGTIDAAGKVGPIGGIKEKVAGARRGGATIFLVPRDNCRDLVGVETDLLLVRVDSLTSAIDSLNKLNTQGDQAAVPACG